MPKRARSGDVSIPRRVVAPTSVNRSIGMVMVCAFGPSDSRISILKSSIAG